MSGSLKRIPSLLTSAPQLLAFKINDSVSHQTAVEIKQVFLTIMNSKDIYLSSDF